MLRFESQLAVLVLSCVIVVLRAEILHNRVESIQEFLNDYNREAVIISHNSNVAMFEYETNITDENLQKLTQADKDYAHFAHKWSQMALKFNISQFEAFPSIQRQLKFIKTVGIDLEPADAEALSELVGKMSATYAKTAVCSLQGSNLTENCSVKWRLEPDITKFLEQNRDYDALFKIWRGWYESSGRPIRKMFEQYVNVSNKGAKVSGFSDTGEYWRWLYETDDFEDQMEQLFFGILPLYEQLHAFARKKLQKLYPGRFNTAAIPAHILGNMWAQEWQNLLPVLTPFPAKNPLNVTMTMLQQNITVKKMFEMGDDFFQSIGLKKLPEKFWKRSMLVKPEDRREVVCHASAFDMYEFEDVRIKMCTEVDFNYFTTIHHELGHIQYYLQYADRPAIFRTGANPGFHEAIGDVIALSVSTPEHLKTVGLLKEYKYDRERDLNYLMQTALRYIPFMPFGYLVDKWRYEVFERKIQPKDWNARWWQMVHKYQGLGTTHRMRDEDFDPGAKMHVASNVEYLRYFVAFVLKFQLYKAMCKNADNRTNALHHCDFYRNKEAGQQLGRMLSQGSSKFWPNLLEQMTGQRKMSAAPLLEYFQPLFDWLREQNKDECFGWGEKWPKNVMDTLEKNRCSLVV